MVELAAGAEVGVVEVDVAVEVVVVAVAVGVALSVGVVDVVAEGVGAAVMFAAPVVALAEVAVIAFAKVGWAIAPPPQEMVDTAAANRRNSLYQVFRKLPPIRN